MPFQLDERLQRDTLVVGDWPLCRVLLMNDSQYPWLILVPRRINLCELFQLSELDALQCLKESNGLAAFMSRHFKADKMNVANLGNVVAQLHIHHIARFRGDAAWPGPVWGKFPAQAYTPSALDALMAEMQSLLALEMPWIE